MEQLNNQFELEKIKKKLLMTYTRYNATNIPYTDEELLKAAIQIKSFFDKLNNMVIYEDNVSRKLNNLELFVAIYEFVADRVYAEQDTCHDIIGALIMEFGMSKIMVGKPSNVDMLIGIITGVLGLIICVLNYPIYTYINDAKK